MSRVGNLPIKLPDGVNLTIDKDFISAQGPKGNLQQFQMPGISVSVEDEQVIVKRRSDEKVIKSKHGLMRSLVSNMIEGVSHGFSKKLEINGVGYRVQQTGNDLKFSLGFSHDVVYKVPDGISVSIDQNIITLSGVSKQQVGQVAAQIRSLKKPEPYKGKGIKYLDEIIIRKSGKSGKETA